MKTTDELEPFGDSTSQAEFDLDSAVAEAQADSDFDSSGKLHISEDVVQEIARRALTRVSSVAPASAGGFGIGRKSSDGVRVSLEEGNTHAQISVDAYVLVRYGLRIPDVAWDVQEFLKNELESSTGYEVKAVNIFVQGVFFGEKTVAEDDVLSPTAEDAKSEHAEPKAALATAGE